MFDQSSYRLYKPAIIAYSFLPIQGVLSVCMIGSDSEWHMYYACLCVYLFKNIEDVFD